MPGTHSVLTEYFWKGEEEREEKDVDWELDDHHYRENAM